MKRVKLQSSFEKFCEGLRVIKTFQAAPVMSIQGKFFCVGDAEDPYISKGAKDFLADMGFSVRDGKFCYEVDEED